MKIDRLRALCSIASLVLASGCATAHRQQPEPPGSAGAGGGAHQVEIGMASYYGRAHHGNATASGAPFDMNAMTAAHPRYPFGSILRVTDLESGRSVLVKVNDRGPFTRERVIDLSYAAARALGIVERGVARVRVERVE